MSYYIMNYLQLINYKFYFHYVIYDCYDYFNIRYIKKNLHSALYEASLLVKIIRKIYKDEDNNNNDNLYDDDEMSVENEEINDKYDMEEMKEKVVKDVVIKKYRVVKTFLSKKIYENNGH